MKINYIQRSEDRVVYLGYKDALSVEIDGSVVFNVSDGEPEDATMTRDFNDCWKIDDLLEIAYIAGKRGEEFEIEYKTSDEI